MKKGAAGLLLCGGAWSWWVSKAPAERIVRVKPDDKWRDINGYPEDEFILPVSFRKKLPTEFRAPDESANKGYVQTLTFYEKWHGGYHMIGSYENLSVDEANQKIMDSHNKRMLKTTLLHQIWYERSKIIGG
jgi:hypothetical protein